MATVLKDAKIRVVLDLEQAKRALSETEKRQEENERKSRQEERAKRDEERKARKEGRGGAVGGAVAGRAAGGSLAGGFMGRVATTAASAAILAEITTQIGTIIDGYLTEKFGDIVGEFTMFTEIAKGWDDLKATVASLVQQFTRTTDFVSQVGLAGGTFGADDIEKLLEVNRNVALVDRQIEQHKRRISRASQGATIANIQKNFKKELEGALGGMNK